MLARLRTFFDWLDSPAPLRRLSRPLGIGMLALTAALMAYAAISAGGISGPSVAVSEQAQTDAGPPDNGDLALYARIVERVASGDNYHFAAVAEHRARNYPVQPFVTVRLPTLAWAFAALGEGGVRWIAIALLVAAVLVWERRLTGFGISLLERAGFAILLYFGAAGIFAERGLLLHELPAGLLLTLAMGLYGTRFWLLGIIAALAAVAIREIAVPFLLVWLVLALVERRWREVVAVLVAFAVFAAIMLAHAAAVATEVQPGDPASGGWAAALGLDFVFTSLASFTWLLLLPTALGAALAVLAATGWLVLGGRLTLFAALWLGGFLLAVAVFARADNLYWVQLTMPAYLAGLALAPRAIRDLLASAKAPELKQS